MEAHGEETVGRGFDFMGREVVLRADLAGRDEDGCIWTSVRFLMRGPRPPRPGERVVLMDASGGSCLGRVELVKGWKACVKPDLSTWSGAGGPPPRVA
jgi:hypothetical protein